MPLDYHNDIAPLKTKAEVEKRVQLWANKLQTYEDALELVSLAFLNESLPNGARMTSKIRTDEYGILWRQRVVNKIIHFWEMRQRYRATVKEVERSVKHLADSLSSMQIATNEEQAKFLILSYFLDRK